MEENFRATAVPTTEAYRAHLLHTWIETRGELWPSSVRSLSLAIHEPRELNAFPSSCLIGAGYNHYSAEALERERDREKVIRQTNRGITRVL